MNGMTSAIKFFFAFGTNQTVGKESYVFQGQKITWDGTKNQFMELY